MGISRELKDKSNDPIGSPTLLSIGLRSAKGRLAVDPRHPARHPYAGMAYIKITTSQLGQLTKAQRPPGREQD